MRTRPRSPAQGIFIMNIAFSVWCTQRIVRATFVGALGETGGQPVHWSKGTCRAPACSQTNHNWLTLAPKGGLALSTPKWGRPYFHCSLAHQKPCFLSSSPWLCWGLRGFFLPFLSLRVIICPHYQALHIYSSE